MGETRPRLTQRLLQSLWDPFAVASASARRPRAWLRLLVSALIEGAAFAVVLWSVPGVRVTTVEEFLVTTVFVGLLNAALRPVLLSATLGLTILSLGLFSLLVNAGILMLAARLLAGFEIGGGGSAVAAAVILSAVGATLASLFRLSHDQSFYGLVARRAARRHVPRGSGGQGLLIIQIDGLAEPVMRFAVRTGLMPTAAGWLRDGGYRLRSWECALPSQTSASQAGLLFGNNFDIPGFRWYEKESKRWMVSNRARDAAEIGQRHSAGAGLLSGGGTCVATLLDGDATRTPLVLGALPSRAALRSGDFYSYFLSPNQFVRSLFLVAREVIREVGQARRQRSRDVQPRVRRGFRFALARAATGIMADLTTTMVVDSMYAGAPVIFANYLAYDEVAHHAGPERPEALDELSHIDDTLAALERIGRSTARTYRLVVLSDHGQSQGRTFLQQFGITLEDLIQSLVGSGEDLIRSVGTAEGWLALNSIATEALLATNPTVRGAIGRIFANQIRDGVFELGGTPDDEAAGGRGESIVVCSSGNLALVYLPGEGRLTLEEIERRHPFLVAGLASHAGIGFVMVHSERAGAVVAGASGTHYLRDGRVIGTDPLAPFGPHAAESLRRLDGFPHIADIVLNSSYHEGTQEVAAFEELVGSHGGLGGSQTLACLLSPGDLQCPDDLFGAEAVHDVLMRWRQNVAGPREDSQVSV